MSGKSDNVSGADLGVQRADSLEEPADKTAGAGADADETSPDTARRKVSTADIQHVQNLIERCLQLYMPQQEVVAKLQAQAKIDPSFTQLVWQKLEEQNPEFFEAYNLRLKVKDQIVMFNYLLGQQQQALQQLQASWMAPEPGAVAGSSSLGAGMAAAPATLATGPAIVAPARPAMQCLWSAGMPMPQAMVPPFHAAQGAPPLAACILPVAGPVMGMQGPIMQQLLFQQQHPWNMQHAQRASATAARPIAPQLPDFLMSGSSSSSASSSAGATPTNSAPAAAEPADPAGDATSMLRHAPPQQQEHKQGALAGRAIAAQHHNAASPGFPKPFSFNDLAGLAVPAFPDASHMDFGSHSGGKGLMQHSAAADGDGDMLMGETGARSPFGF